MAPTAPERLADWTRRISRSDRSAFTEMFRATYPPLYRYALRLTRNGTLAEDLVQEVYVRIWIRREKLQSDGSLRGLLYRSVRNLALNRSRDDGRRRSALEAFESSPGASEPDAMTGADMLRERMATWIDELPPRRREAFHLSRFDGLTHREIAEIMGISEKTVENHMTLALTHLRTRLTQLESQGPIK